MAEVVVGAVITVLCEKLISGNLIKLARSKGIESQLKKWKKTLPLIQAVLVDASKKQIKETAIQQWLNELQDLAYDIEDVLDGLATNYVRRKLNQESHASSSSTIQVLKIIPTCCTNFTPSNIMYGRQMSSKLDEITTKLNDLVEVKNNLGLNVTMNVERLSRKESRPEETSLVNVPKLMGREVDRKALLGRLLGNNENVSILSIVGLGGIGKTTLAKDLYHQVKVKKHFELRAWVSVGCEMDVFNISKSIFQEVKGETKDFASLNNLHVALQEELSKKRFLLVLDDVWNEDASEWERLRSPFLVGAPGSTIIVTTRNTRVAWVMGTEEAHHLEVLSNEDALSLFAQNALGEQNFNKHPTLKSHAEGIVKKCGRLPLALKTIGMVLKRNRNGDEWEELLNSEIWEKSGSEVLPALRVSYNVLPPELKRLFAYCSLFPKDYMFDKNKLVLHWMAQGYLSKSNGKKSMESLGHEYFEELESRSFFQHSVNDEFGYTMHDLINDLAKSVAGEFFFRLDEEMDASDLIETFEKFRHFSLIGPQCGSYRKLREVHKARRLRTFLPMSFGWENYCLMDNIISKLLSELQFLRVLSLTHWIISAVPQSIGTLKHLQYLNFSSTPITCLPEQVSDLYNLQTLLVSGCYKLFDLPESIGKLVNLRHLDISDTPMLHRMPFGIGGLTSLQTLPKVMIVGDNGFRIDELKGLSDLQGKLSILWLQKVINPIQAKDANLHQKKGLDIVELVWSHLFDDSREEMIEYKVLEELRPHLKLKHLKIWFYKGLTFPSWVGDCSFDRLTELTFIGCKSAHLPTLGHLPSLQKLVVKSMNEVVTLGFEFLASSDSFHGIAFPSLEILEFDSMQGWQRWSTSGALGDGTIRSFPHLREILVKNCPKLSQVSIELIPSLQILHMEECSEVGLRSMLLVSPSLVSLKVGNVKGLTQLFGEGVLHLGEVESLYIDKCDELRYLWDQESEACQILPSLHKLEVSNCKKLVSLGKKKNKMGIKMESIKEVKFYKCDRLQSYKCPMSVERLAINYCRSITSLKFSTVLISEGIPEKDFGISPLSCLRSLEILDCKSLKSFPYKHLQRLTSLEEISIDVCPSIDYSFPCGLWPRNLKTLVIGCLNKPMAEWGIQNFPSSLVAMHLKGKNSGVVSFRVAEDARNTTASSSFILPASLASLTLQDFMDVESLSDVLQHLPCLKHLEIWSWPKLKDLPETTSLLTVIRRDLDGKRSRLANV